jgi:hypothetical protein
MPSTRRSIGAQRALERAVDRLRDRSGSEAVTQGVPLGRDEGPTAPRFPD